MRKCGWGIVTLLLVLVLDQWSKWYVVEVMVLSANPREVTGFFNLVMVWNYGVSFGMLANNHELGRWLLIGLSGSIALGVAVWMVRTRHKLLQLAQGLVIGGAVGNIVDRFRYGAVADFLDLHWRGYHWPAFNVADAAIVCGVALLLLDGIVMNPQQASSGAKA